LALGFVAAVVAPALVIPLVALMWTSAQREPQVSDLLGAFAILGLYFAIPALTVGPLMLFAFKRVARPTLSAAIVVGVLVGFVGLLLLMFFVGPFAMYGLILSLPAGVIGGAAFWLVALRGLRPTGV
jgi:p-aminobenzoyl-glutamate transporter AbgT